MPTSEALAQPPLTVVPKRSVEELVFESPTVAIGRFRCPPDHALFRDSGPSNAYCFVFPRTSVWIQHADGPPFVADPAMVTYYNEGQVYSRRALSPDGDRAEWFAVAPAIASEILAAVSPRTLGHGRRVFAAAHGPSDPATYLRQRRLVEHVRAQADADPLAVEESVLGLLARVAALGNARPARPHGQPSRRQRDLVENAKTVLAATALQRVRLPDIAARLSCSVFHLCRTFLNVEGRTMHAYRHDVRLRMALEAVTDRRQDLSQVALQYGFSSHSHFTAAFRVHFDATPSAVGRRTNW